MFEELTLLENSGIVLAMTLFLSLLTKKAYRTETYAGSFIVFTFWFLTLTALLIFPIILLLNLVDGANVIIALFSWLASIVFNVLFWDKRRKR